jgi:hypothetical protein
MGFATSSSARLQTAGGATSWSCAVHTPDDRKPRQVRSDAQKAAARRRCASAKGFRSLFRESTVRARKAPLVNIVAAARSNLCGELAHNPSSALSVCERDEGHRASALLLPSAGGSPINGIPRRAPMGIFFGLISASCRRRIARKLRDPIERNGGFEKLRSIREVNLSDMDSVGYR